MVTSKYVLITAALNEEAYIEGTIKSVLQQTLRPVKWVIVSDGSTDKTDEIAGRYAQENEFIDFVRKERSQGQEGFASKVAAIHIGYQRLKGLDYDFIGNLDADLSFEADYFQELLKRFADNPGLGIGGGYIHENLGGIFRSRPSNAEHSVAGGVQLFRREFYEAIGGLQPLALGGEDWYAEIRARMTGWEVRAFPELRVFHNKRSVTARGVLRENFRQGKVDYSLGSHPLFELAKCLRRMGERPFLVGPCCRMAGYLWSTFTGQRAKVPDEVRAYLRKEQVDRMRFLIRKPNMWRAPM